MLFANTSNIDTTRIVTKHLYRMRPNIVAITTTTATMNHRHSTGSSGPLSNTGVVIGNIQQQQQQHQLQQQQQSILHQNNILNHQQQQQHHQKLPSQTIIGTGNTASTALDNLPKQFVNSMRTLFDIMDDKRTGFVRLADIEQRWQDDGSKGLPPGVIDSLRRVTPASGLLSFERFCAGLKICLLKNQSEGKGSRRSSTSTSSDSNNSNVNVLATAKETTSKSSRPPSVPLLDLEKPIVLSNQWNSNNTAAVRPNNALSVVQRTLSLPKLSPGGSDGGDSGSSDRYASPMSIYAAPPKPPRTALLLNNGQTNINQLDRFDKAEIRHALQNWQMNVLMNEMDAKDKRRAVAIPNCVSLNRESADGSSPNSIYSNGVSHINTNNIANNNNHNIINNNNLNAGQQQQKIAAAVQHKKSNTRRREPRRHTLQNGIDYQMLKRLKHYEEEKDVLMQGLNAVEKTQEWYFKQLAIVEDKIKYLGRIESHSVSLVIINDKSSTSYIQLITLHKCNVSATLSGYPMQPILIVWSV